MTKFHNWFVLLFLFFLDIAVTDDCMAANKLKVGYVPGGLYEQYVKQHFSETAFDELTIELVSTEGSRHQVELLQQGKIDLAVIQNDIAYYVYEGKRGYKINTNFSLVLPLFPEYLQIIVRTDSDIFTFGKLFQGAVSTGPKGSGSYQNAKDLFTELGFRAGVDFEQRHLPISDALLALKAGDIDGIVYTGGVFPIKNIPDPEAFRLLNIPDNVMQAMAIKSSYYTLTSTFVGPGKNQEATSTLALTAILVASNKVHEQKVHTVIEKLTSKEGGFELKNKQHILTLPPESAIEKSPIPLHEGLKSFLRNQGHLGKEINPWLVIPVLCFIMAGIFFIQIRMKSYDRMGNLTIKNGSPSYYIHHFVTKSGSGLILLLAFSLLIIVFVELIQYFEDDYARRLNISNPFADKGYKNTFLWVVTFMGAGDPGDMFPNSDMGKLLASALPFLGLGTVLGFGFSTVEKRREKVAEAKRGTLKKTIQDHVLICGWNDKAPSIIYSLTGKEAPRKREVIVIAEMDEDSPLEKYGFDSRYVSYCRGDSADYKVLCRANAKYADVAVVLGGVKKRSGKNIKSVLSTLALKEVARKNIERDNEMMIITELLFEENHLGKLGKGFATYHAWIQ